jgi:hypothetical protein
LAFFFLVSTSDGEARLVPFGALASCIVVLVLSSSTRSFPRTAF